jgi:hydroxymethylpyrimidine/phosphomethylpyrimidine kinase
MATTLQRVVLCLSGHDPTGGAGIHADIEAIAAQGAHAATVITAHTVQDSHNVSRVVAADPQLLGEQLAALRADLKLAAIKVGLLADAAQPALIAKLARETGVPLVVDPVLRAGGGAELADAALIGALKTHLLPVTTLLTPNAADARRLTGLVDLDDCGKALLLYGCTNVLITGGDELGDTVVNRWYGVKGATGPARAFAWPRIEGAFHGAGCTLAAAAAALLARGEPLAQALFDAQAYVHRCLQAAHAPGSGRQFPGRTA